MRQKHDPRTPKSRSRPVHHGDSGAIVARTSMEYHRSSYRAGLLAGMAGEKSRRRLLGKHRRLRSSIILGRQRRLWRTDNAVWTFSQGDRVNLFSEITDVDIRIGVRSPYLILGAYLCYFVERESPFCWSEECIAKVNGRP